MPLAVCATPIGNLQDVTLRVLDELRGAEIVLCEDTRHTGLLLARHEIRKPLVSYHEFNEAKRTPELLREPHGPIHRNPLLAESLLRVKLVEKAGTGTTDMIADCRVAGLSEPDFRQCGPHFVATLWRSNAKGRVAGSESGSESRTESGSESWRERSEWRPEWGAESVHGRVMQALFTGALARSQIAAAIGHKSVSRALRQALADLLKARLVAYTMPERPNSRLQRYRMTLNRGR